MAKLRVGVLYGGRSAEHEISVASAASVCQHLDPTRYEPVPIRIERDGRWTIAERPPSAPAAADVIAQARRPSAPAPSPDRRTLPVPYPGGDTIVTVQPMAGAERGQATAIVTGLSLDVVFPVLHGPFGEDGTVQGLLELAGVPYVGSGVLASAAGMDKAVMKVLFAARDLPVVPYRIVRRREWEAARATVEADIAALGLPVFVKPANMGSSVGITKVKRPTELAEAAARAFEYDAKLVVEAAVASAREIECAVLGNDEPEASVPGEIVPSREFYDYEAKYLDAGSRTLIPAPLSAAEEAAVRRMAIEAFQAIEAAGLSRVDFLLAPASGALYVNEINTMPGFTTISMYPKLWEASGVSYGALVDRLIALALEQHAHRRRLRTSAV